jgi:hypothetical protein
MMMLMPLMIDAAASPPTWRTHSCVQRSHSCERVFFIGHVRSYESAYHSNMNEESAQ